MPETDRPEMFLLLQVVREELTEKVIDVLQLMAADQLDVERFTKLSIEVKTLMNLIEKV